jgi:hypothetical protein
MLLVFSGTVAISQVTIDKSIQLNGPTGTRQLDSLGQSRMPENAVSAVTVQSGVLNFAVASGIDTLIATSTISSVPLTAGTRINLKITNQNTGAVVLNLNGSGNIPVKRAGMYNLKAGELRAGVIITLLYDGTSYQIVSSGERGCPAGFTEVNRQFCIETNEHPTATFFNAVAYCFGMNARLCTWGEWYYACQKSGLGISAMTNNFEWVDTAANEDGQVRVVGYGGCTGAGAPYATSIYTYRCCFSK